MKIVVLKIFTNSFRTITEQLSVIDDYILCWVASVYRNWTPPDIL